MLSIWVSLLPGRLLFIDCKKIQSMFQISTDNFCLDKVTLGSLKLKSRPVSLKSESRESRLLLIAARSRIKTSPIICSLPS